MTSDFENEFDLDKVCSEFEKFKGGNIELMKDNSDGIAYLRINNSEKKNSFTGSMIVQFKNVLTELENWHEGRAVIIYGAENFFCSGGDLNMVKKLLNKKNGFEMSKLMQLNLNRLQNLKLITLCLIQCKAIGGGAELITSCDFRLAVRSAKIGFIHKGLGITTGWSGGVRLVNLIGKTKALDLLLYPRQLNAEQALEYGLINHILEDNDNFNQILTSAKQWLSKYIQGSIQTIQAIKSIVNAASTLSYQDALDLEIQKFISVWGADAHRNALDANIKHR